MLGLGFYLFFLMAAMGAAMFMRLRFDVVFTRRGKDDYLGVKMTSLCGLIRYQTEVPVVDLDRYFLEPIIKMEADLESVVNHPIGDRGMLVKIPVMTLIRNLPKFVQQGIIHAERYEKVMRRFLKNMRCHELAWRSEIGLSDPALTGIASGLLWGAKGFAFSVFKSHVGMMAKPPKLSVQPCFDTTCLRLDFRCIFDLRLGHIIIAGLEFAKLRLRA